MKAITYSKSILDYVRSLNSSNRFSKTLLITSADPSKLTSNTSSASASASSDNISASNKPLLSSYRTSLENEIDKTKFQIGIQHSIPIIECQNNPSAFPTSNDIDLAYDLCKRSGCGAQIIGVGSKSSIHLAKAVSQKVGCENLVFIPKTFGSFMASGMESALIYDVDEQGIFPYSNNNNNENTASEKIKNTSVILPNKFDSLSLIIPPNGLSLSPSISDVIYASLAICLDYHYSKTSDEEMNDFDDDVVKPTVQNCLDLLVSIQNDTNNNNTFNGDNYSVENQLKLADILLKSGQLLSFGTDGRKRSVPLTFGCSILPNYYPHVNFITFMASLFPGISRSYYTTYRQRTTENTDSLLHKVHELANNNDYDDNQILNPAPSLASMIETTNHPSVDDMLDLIDKQSLLWKNANGVDLDENMMEEILHYSLSR